MRGCLSYETVSLMKRGRTPKEACEEALRGLSRRKLELGEDEGSISLIALSPEGAFGAATTLPVFPFAAGDASGATLYAVDHSDNPVLRLATEEELEDEP